MLEAEMDWIPRYFSHFARKWERWAKASEAAGRRGHSVYAWRQVNTWEAFRLQAETAFAAARSRAK